jgi:hypothetical protein
VIHEFGREIHFADSQILSVHEFLKMTPDELLPLRVRHADLGILEFQG